MKHSEYVNIVKGFGENALKKAMMGAVIKQLPLFALGPWNYVLGRLAGWLAINMVEEAEMRVFFLNVDFRTSVQAKDFESAMVYNHTIQQIGTEEEKREAEKKLVDALNKLVTLSK